MKNKIISLFILFALVLSACGSDTNSSKSGDNNTAEPEEATIEETVIYDENDIVITAVDLEYDGIFGPTLNLLVENNSDKDYIIQCDYATINELICLSNMENLNAVFIEQGMPQGERLVKLNQIAIHQMKVLESDGTPERQLLK